MRSTDFLPGDFQNMQLIGICGKVPDQAFIIEHAGIQSLAPLGANRQDASACGAVDDLAIDQPGLPIGKPLRRNILARMRSQVEFLIENQFAAIVPAQQPLPM